MYDGCMWNFFSSLLQHVVDRWQRREADKPREDILRDLLTNPPPGKEWRTMDMLSRSIGADEAETTRLLLKIGARRSTGDSNVWALKSKKPI